ncbi:hypothetical protein IQ244_30210 [Nostoc sp. LEGE 06077]|nr:hypothetical protein [Nostoc sp. LEGE 06077]
MLRFLRKYFSCSGWRSHRKSHHLSFKVTSGNPKTPAINRSILKEV